MTAVKHDEGKPRTDLLEPKGLIGEAKAMGYGIQPGKYNEYNYKDGDGLDWSRPYAAALRHLFAFWDGEDLDKESGLPHLYHAKASIGMLIGLIENGKGKDNRWKI